MLFFLASSFAPLKSFFRPPSVGTNTRIHVSVLEWQMPYTVLFLFLLICCCLPHSNESTKLRWYQANPTFYFFIHWPSSVINPHGYTNSVTWSRYSPSCLAFSSNLLSYGHYVLFCTFILSPNLLTCHVYIACQFLQLVRRFWNQVNFTEKRRLLSISPYSVHSGFDIICDQFIMASRS